MPRTGHESISRASALSGPVSGHFWLRAKRLALQRSVRAPPSKLLLCGPDPPPERIRIFRRRLRARDLPKQVARFRSPLAVACRQSASLFQAEQAVLTIE